MESGGTRAASVRALTWRQGGARSRSMTSDSEAAAKTRHIESNLSCQATRLVAQVLDVRRARRERWDTHPGLQGGSNSLRSVFDCSHSSLVPGAYDGEVLALASALNLEAAAQKKTESAHARATRSGAGGYGVVARAPGAELADGRLSRLIN